MLTRPAVQTYAALMHGLAHADFVRLDLCPPRSVLLRFLDPMLRTSAGVGSWQVRRDVGGQQGTNLVSGQAG